jgi:hypothetical protein
MDRIDIDGNYLIIEKTMPDQNVDSFEFVLKNTYYQTNEQSIVICDLMRLIQSFVIPFDDVPKYTNFDGDKFTIESMIAFLRKNTGTK